MRLSVVLFSLCLALLPSRAGAQETGVQADSARTRYEKMMTRRMEMWQRLIPDHYKMQFAGSIGMVSLGTGWTYGKKKQWETDLMFGFLPKFESERHKLVGGAALVVQYVPFVRVEREVLDAGAGPLSERVLRILHPHTGQLVLGAAHYV